jgi:CBS domain-containing protein
MSPRVFHTRSIPAPAARSASMDSPGITRRRRPRRPFLAPLWLSSIALMAAVGAALLVLHSASTTVVVLIQQKESGDAGEVEQRAERLAAMFGSRSKVGHLDALYVSDAGHAKETVAPLAELLHKQPITIPGNDPEGAASRVMEEHQGDTVLVVGTGDKMPELVRQLSGVEVQRDRDDVAYVVSIPSIGRTNLLRFVY